MNSSLNKRNASLLALACTLGACGSTTPRWDSSFGDSLRASTAAQVMHPDAARNPNPVAGLDGRAAAAAQARYEHTANNAPAPSTMLGAGGSK